MTDGRALGQLGQKRQVGQLSPQQQQECTLCGPAVKAEISIGKQRGCVGQRSECCGLSYSNRNPIYLAILVLFCTAGNDTKTLK